MRNGNRWHVTAINPDDNRLTARRLDDNTPAVFDGDYVREHISLGYAVTVHSAQGVTADTTHAVLGENTSRAMLYVAMTRGRDTNTAYLYERTSEHEYGSAQPEGVHVMARGGSDQAGQLLRAIVANDRGHQITAHDVAAQTPSAAMPERVRRLVDRWAAAVDHRRAIYKSWQAEMQYFVDAMDLARERHTSLGASSDQGVGL